MRKIAMVCGLIVMLAGMTMAQPVTPIDKGSWMVGGTVLFASQSGDAYEDFNSEGQTTITINPQAGYFIAPHIMIGADVMYEHFSWGDFSTTDFIAGPTVGYFFNMDQTREEVSGSLYPYVRALIGFGTSKIEEPDGDGGTDEISNSLLTFGAQGGVIFMLSNAVGADLAVRFTSDQIGLDNDLVGEGDDDSINGTTLQIGVGIQAFIF